MTPAAALPQVMEGMAAAQEALQLLIPAGDYAGALDILYDLSTSGAPMAVAALHAFRDLPQQLTQAAEVPAGNPAPRTSSTLLAADLLRRLLRGRSKWSGYAPAAAQRLQDAEKDVCWPSKCVPNCAGQEINSMMAADFLRVAQSQDLDAAMDRALSTMQSVTRCAARCGAPFGCLPCGVVLCWQTRQPGVGAKTCRGCSCIHLALQRKRRTQDNQVHLWL